MGLLQRAAITSTTSKPDLMAEALVERILRLAPTQNKVYMVLSLLKTYIPFQGAFVLEQKNDTFTALEIIGLDVQKFTVKDSEVLPHLPNKADSWFPADFIKSWDVFQNKDILSAKGYLLSKVSMGSIIIIFVEDPNEKVLLEDATYILSRIHTVFIRSPLIDDKNKWDPTLWINELFSELLKPGSTLTIGIFEKPESPESLEKALGNRGKTHVWGDSKFIIVMENSVDTELYFHRIQKSFNIKLLDSFETADSLAAVQRLS